MGNIIRALQISPWWIFVIFGYPIAFAIWNFFRTTLIQTYIYLRIHSLLGRAILLIIFSFMLFGALSIRPLIYYGEIARFLSVASLLITPGVIIACWPTRAWVIMQMKKMAI